MSIGHHAITEDICMRSLQKYFILKAFNDIF